MPTLHRADDYSGAYQFGDSGKHDRDKRFTAYVKYQQGDEVWLEEIDINAPNREAGHAIAAAALERDYEPGGTVVELREQIGWYM